MAPKMRFPSGYVASSSKKKGKEKSQGKGKKQRDSPPPSRKEIVDRMEVIPQKGIKLEILHETTIPTTIETLGWEKLAEHPINYNLTLVKEFYHAIPELGSIFPGVFVRNKYVEVTPQIINNYYGIEEDPNWVDGWPDMPPFQNRWTHIEANEIRAYPKPHETIQGFKHLEFTAPLAFMNVFQAYNIWPALRWHDLRQSQPEVIYAIHRRLPFNVGRLMLQAIEFHLRNERQLVFPSLITHLCLRAQVRSRKTDEIRTPPRLMGKGTYNDIAAIRNEPEITGALSRSDNGGNDGTDPPPGFSQPTTEAAPVIPAHPQFPPSHSIGSSSGPSSINSAVGQQDQIISLLQGIQNSINLLTGSQWALGNRITALEMAFKEQFPPPPPPADDMDEE